MVMLSVLNNPVLTLQLGILGKLLGLMGRIVKGCVREVSLAQVSCILMYVYVAPPTPVGAWSMALGLRQRFEYYYYNVGRRYIGMARMPASRNTFSKPPNSQTKKL